ncbi:DUF167 domain-containing protein [Thermodesulfobacteriota bacterium]
MLAFTEKLQGIVFKVFVQPKSSKNMIAGLYGDALKVKLTAPPVEDAANKMCIKYLAKCLKVPNSSLKILSGHSSRTKLILFRYTDSEASLNEKKHLKGLVGSLLPAA